MNITTNKKVYTTLPAKTSLNLIIHGRNNQICVDSRDIAKEFGRQHKNVLQTLDNLLAGGTLSRLESKPRFYTKLGRQYRCFELNKAGFLKAMPFIGGRKSREGQRRFVDEFLRLESAMIRQSKERETMAYQVARQSGKDSRIILTDAIQEFVAYAKTQGSKNADRYFCSITKAVQQSILVIEPHVTDVRELLTAIQLANLNLIELTATQALTEGIAKKLQYKDVYKAMKMTLESCVAGKSTILGSY
jgi:phage regulator Rha-like protein